MTGSIRVRADLKGDVTDVQTLIKHPMDSGLARNENGAFIPPHYIETVTFQHQGLTVFVANWGPLIAKDPYVRFSFTGGNLGDAIEVKWIDSQKAEASLTTHIEDGKK